ncbi:ArnT family glycosyltransferase [Spartinivicinus poritis]|uniref:Glycosyltransferase family 39 protein n=1 Tax=Spartinivicinus poritis TaxID=2994640 RepID=A0ABT5UC42_9GAMM|nr:glycosyltransferase family 39 protein [Spartinivicinus sp. A2-2]MDE1463954.1 glycosyltransferase family 39 protein [Spartinivicinus sp. A2-2]
MLIKLFDNVNTKIWYILPLLVVYSFFSMIFIQSGTESVYTYFYSFLLSLFSLLLFYKASEYIKSSFQNQTKLMLVPLYYLFWIGLLIRLAVVYFLPVEQASDSATYVSLAQNLIENNVYGGKGTGYAYWPPGYPLVLYVFHLGIFDITPFSISLLNVIIYIFSFYLIYKATKRIGGEKSAFLACLIFIFWPQQIMITNVAGKENIVFLLLLLSFYMSLIIESKYKFVIVGSLLGLCTLIQPGTIFLFTAILVLKIHQKETVRSIVSTALFVVIGAALIISPWTYRNYNIFNEFVLVSTNGGSNFYRANNELATGGYTDQGKIVVTDLSEVEEGKAYKQLAIDWIASNPADFLLLMGRKLILNLGDDSGGVYATFKLSGSSPIKSDIIYYALKLISTLFWVLLWLILWIGRRHFIKQLKENHSYVFISLCFLYFIVVHMVFESNSKYHYPGGWAIVILVGLVSIKLLNTEKPAKLEK